MIGTLVWTSSYSVFSGDDFAVLDFTEDLDHNVWTSVEVGFENAAHFYMQWQGTWFGAFLGAAINPVWQYGLGQLRWVMAINSSLFWGALLFFVFCALKNMGLKANGITLVIATSIIFSLCAYETYPEIFFWFSGATVYGVPMSCLLLGLALYIGLANNSSKIVAIVAALLVLLGMGGTLVVAGTGCYAALLLLLYDCIEKKKIASSKLIVFITMMLGALINALAPGNFKRHDTIDDSGLHITKAVISAFSITSNRWVTLLGYNFLLLIMVVFACGIITKRRKQTKLLSVVFSALGLLTPVVASFPYALGTQHLIPANRVAFIIDLGIILSTFLFSFLVGNSLATAMSYKLNTIAITIVIVTMFFYCKYDGYGLSDFKTFELTRLHNADVFENHYNAHVRFYDWLKGQEGEDVIVTPEHCPYGIDNVYNLYISIDADNWVNKLIARHYGVNSISTDYD
jgi:hypothetical protein